MMIVMDGELDSPAGRGDRLQEEAAYASRGLEGAALNRLERLAALLLSSPANVVGARTLEDIEKRHFLDALSLLEVPGLRGPGLRLADVGSGGGLPALVLAIALPEARITAIESVGKKCAFIRRAGEDLGVSNVDIVCARAEDYGRLEGRGRFDLCVTRAVGMLALVAELSAPLLRVGGLFVAMKGRLSSAEWDNGLAALDILGVEQVVRVAVTPFPEARDRQLVVGRKVRATPAGLPRRGAALMRRPLGPGSAVGARGERPESSVDDGPDAGGQG